MGGLLIQYSIVLVFKLTILNEKKTFFMSFVTNIHKNKTFPLAAN